MPKVSQEILDEILSRVDIVEVISSHIPLKKIGKSFKALCPFHNEKTASFIVSQEKQIYHCFGCGSGGNVFNFLIQYERLTFQEAVEVLARKAQVTLPRQENSKEASLTANLHKINELALEFYHSLLLKSNEAHQAREYLKKRNISQETIAKFKIGFAPSSWAALLDFLRAKNIPLALIEKCGLIIPRQNSGYYDRFRNRLVFPIFDLKSRVVAFSARVLDNTLPKYINSPDTPVFSKGKLLYGLNLAKEHIRENDYLLIVEGNFDFISLYQAGILNTVATLGTALTLDHARLIKRYTENVKVLFDGDKAGELATLRAFDIFIEEGLNLEIVSLEKGLDPDSYIVKFGVDRLKGFLERSEAFFDYKLKLLNSRFDINSTTGKVEVAKGMLPSIKKINNEVLKAEYLKKLSEHLKIGEQALFDEFIKIKPDAYFNRDALKPEAQSQVLSAEMMLLKLMLKESDLLYRLRENIGPYEFNDPRIADIVSEIFNLINSGQDVNISKLMNQFQSVEHVNILSQASLADDIDFSTRNNISLDKIFNDCLRKIKDERVKSRRKVIQEQIKVAQQKNDQEELRKLMTEFKDCFKDQN